MHGDLYAHNILVSSDGHPKLGDFGASVYYGQAADPVASAIYDAAYEKLEVRAFGFLLEELVEHHDAGDSADAADSVCKALRSMAARCTAIGDLESRPPFATLSAELAALRDA